MTGMRAGRILFVAVVLALAACAGPGPRGREGATELPQTSALRAWHEEKARGGPTFAGSPAWRRHILWVEEGLRARGVEALTRHPVRYRRWYADDGPGADDRSLVVDGRPVPVASYWAYSGKTGPEGVTAPLHLYRRGDDESAFRDRIVVFQVGDIPESMLPMFDAGREFANYTPEPLATRLASRQWFQGNYVIRFGRFDERLRGSGAAGALVVFDMPPERARGLYTFPLLRPGTIGVPGLYLDREAGAKVLAAAGDGKSATLRLEAREEDAEAWFLHGMLPGRDYGTPADEYVLLVTHSDGPNLTQENGGIGMVALSEYFAGMPRAARRRSLLFVIDPQHYMPGRHLVDWYEEFPELRSRIVASVGIEQLGQRAFSSSGGRYRMTALAEPSLIFAQENDRLIAAAIGAVERAGLPRAEVRVPSRGGQGMWQGLGDIAVRRNLPGFALNTGMSGYWTTTTGIESFDAELCRRQLVVLAELTRLLMDAELADIAVPQLDPARNPALSPGVAR